jgi:hypothetical protein
MKQKQTLKSFNELSADSLRVTDAENELKEPLKFQTPAKPAQNNPSKGSRPDVRGPPRWGINE